MEPFVARVASIGERAALRQVALKMTVPGVPDIYQGDELPYRALVDPDNRRAVDWDWRQAMLRRLMGGSPPDSQTSKMFLILRLLGLRGRRPDVFSSGAYRPLDAGDRVCAFLRGEEVLVAVALSDDPPDQEIDVPADRWRNVLSGDERYLANGVRASELLGRHGIGVLERLRAH